MWSPPCRARERTAGAAPLRAALVGEQPGAEQGVGMGEAAFFSGCDAYCLCRGVNKARIGTGRSGALRRELGLAAEAASCPAGLRAGSQPSSGRCILQRCAWKLQGTSDAVITTGYRVESNVSVAACCLAHAGFALLK